MQASKLHLYEKYLINHIIRESETYHTLSCSGQLSYKQLDELHFVNGKKIFIVAHAMLQNTPLHTHDYYEFVYILRGALTNVTAHGQMYMSAGNLCIMNLESQHALEAISEETIVVNIGIKKELFQEGLFKQFLDADNYVSDFLRGGTSKQDYLYVPNSPQNTLASLMQSILIAGMEDDLSGQLKLGSYVMLLLTELMNLDEFSYYGVDKKTLQILEYIDENYAHTSVQDIAGQFNYNESYLTRYVKKHTGKQLNKLIVEKRMERAAHFLQYTELNIAEISNLVGYQSGSYFNQIFKKIYLQTPNEFRQTRTSLLPER